MKPYGLSATSVALGEANRCATSAQTRAKLDLGWNKEGEENGKSSERHGLRLDPLGLGLVFPH